MDTELRYVRGFKLHRADIAQGLMQPLPIVEHLDEFKDLGLRFFPRVIVPLMHQLILKRTEEALRPRHCRSSSPCDSYSPAPRAGSAGAGRPHWYTAPLIGVMDQTGRRAAVRHRHPQRPEGDVLIGLGTHRPANDLPVISRCECREPSEEQV